MSFEREDFRPVFKRTKKKKKNSIQIKEKQKIKKKRNGKTRSKQEKTKERGEHTIRGRRAVVIGASIGTISTHREFRDSSVLESVPIDRSVETNRSREISLLG